MAVEEEGGVATQGRKTERHAAARLDRMAEGDGDIPQDEDQDAAAMVW